MKKLILKYWYAYVILPVFVIVAALRIDVGLLVALVLLGYFITLTLYYHEKWRSQLPALEAAILRSVALENMLDQNAVLLEQLRLKLKNRVEGLPIAVIGHPNVWNSLKRCLHHTHHRSFSYVEKPEQLAGRNISGAILLDGHNQKHRELYEYALLRIKRS